MLPGRGGLAGGAPGRDAARLIFIDETWSKANVTRLIGRANAASA
jgi:hypothetical protein